MTKLKLFVLANFLSIVMTVETSGHMPRQKSGQMADSMNEASQTDSFEKKALSSVQKMSASDLDAKLAGSPFANWFKEIIGPKAGVVWQLTECGERIVAPD